MAYDITTIGSATVDYFADTDSELIRIDTRNTHEELMAFPLGEKILINEFNASSGGGGTNTATAFARLGLKTAYLGKIGSDPNGDFILQQLERENISFIGPRDGQSGVSFILNSLRDDRTILAYKGSNNLLRREEVPELESPWVYLASMLEQSWETVVAVLSEGLEAGRFKLAFNPSSYQAELGYDKLRILTDRCSLLIMNREEACKYQGLDPKDKHQPEALATALVSGKDQFAAMTDGAEGVWLSDGTQCWSARPRPDLEIAETTGAGDAFASTFTACLMREMEVADMLHYAMTNAESILQHKGAKEKLLTWKELEAEAGQYSREING